MKRIRQHRRSARSRARREGKIIFITGTDTGVGKTIFTALLLDHLRTAGFNALGMKPFCSGGRDDVTLLHAMQDGELTEQEINPFYFPEPVAPLISARKHKRIIPLNEVVQKIKRTAARCEYLLVEGSGGLLVPLGEKYFVSDLIHRLNCDVIVVSRNRLGTINHTLLTVNALKKMGLKRIKVALVDVNNSNGADASATTNANLLSEKLNPIPVERIKFLGKNPNKMRLLKKSHRIVKKTLARMYR